MGMYAGMWLQTSDLVNQNTNLVFTRTQITCTQVKIIARNFSFVRVCIYLCTLQFLKSIIKTKRVNPIPLFFTLS